MGKIPVGGGWSEILANDSLSGPKVLHSQVRLLVDFRSCIVLRTIVSFSLLMLMVGSTTHYRISRISISTIWSRSSLMVDENLKPSSSSSIRRVRSSIGWDPLCSHMSGSSCWCGWSSNVIGQSSSQLNSSHIILRAGGGVCRRSQFKVGLPILQWSEGRRWGLVGIFFGFSFFKERYNRTSVQFYNLSFLIMKEVLLF